MKTFTTASDIGCIKLFTKDVAFYFRNNFGDVENTILICEEPDRPESDFNFVGSFDVLESDKLSLAAIDSWDDFGDAIYVFNKPGRYFVYLNDKGAIPVFHIQWLDAI